MPRSPYKLRDERTARGVIKKRGKKGETTNESIEFSPVRPGHLNRNRIKRAPNAKKTKSPGTRLACNIDFTGVQLLANKILSFKAVLVRGLFLDVFRSYFLLSIRAGARSGWRSLARFTKRMQDAASYRIFPSPFFF